MEAAICDLHDWAEQELPESRRDIPFLKRFLQGCKMQQDRARQKMKNCVELRKSAAKWYKNWDPRDPEIDQLLTNGLLLPQLLKDQEGRTLTVVRATKHDPSAHHMNTIIKVGLMVLETAMEEDPSLAEKGVVCIIDLEGVSYRHILQMTPSIIRDVVHSWQDCYPIRIKCIHFINTPSAIHFVLSLMKSFMREKLRRRVHTHGYDLAKLQDIMGLRLLPEDYGGTNGTLQSCAEHWKKVLNDKRDWLLKQCNN